MGNFKNLFVWQEAKELGVLIYDKTKSGAISKDFSFKDQIRRAVLSISNNIAEGEDLQTQKQAIRHFFIAKGSCAEVRSMINFGLDLNYFDQEEAEILEEKCLKVSAMLYRLIQKRQSYL